MFLSKILIIFKQRRMTTFINIFYESMNSSSLYHPGRDGSHSENGGHQSSVTREFNLCNSCTLTIDGNRISAEINTIQHTTENIRNISKEYYINKCIQVQFKLG